MKLKKYYGKMVLNSSRPARGAWIETPCAAVYDAAYYVAPRTGRVD
ncbi:hypothetical protein HMPREF1147_2003 [Selenomonas sp. FOBRC9]|nr:hypothetical protein HMPREF1147_2003 [Selenomonas sp. FOBRC9]